MGLVSRDTSDEDPGTKNQITVVVNDSKSVSDDQRDEKSQTVTKREEKSHEKSHDKTSKKNGWPKKKEIITIE